MIIELANHNSAQPSVDDRPKITTIHFPEADEQGLGGYTHEPGALSVPDLKEHLLDSIVSRRGITRLPDHEVLVSLLHPTDGAWGQHANDRPAWVKVHEHDLTPGSRAGDLEGFLSEFWGCPVADSQIMARKEATYWTRFGAPGHGPPEPTMLYLDSGRVMNNVNDGGGQVGAVGTGTAATGTTFTTNLTLVTNAWSGYRIYAMQTATGPLVWGNVISNNNTGGASVVTVDRWYNAATPGGAAATTPSAGFYFMLADGGQPSTWFIGLATGANAAVHGDISLSTNGNVEIVTAGGGLIRKIAPYAQTSGVSTRSITLTPVFTANGSDSLPAIITTIGVFASMVVGYASASGPMKFESALNASATPAASGDQLTVTETINGS